MHALHRPHWIITLALAACLAGAGIVHAASLRVSPVRLDFGPAQQAQAVQITNTGDKELQAQVRVMRWTQQDGTDRLAPTDDLVASPAILRVPPGQQQLVRLVRNRPAAAGAEQAYRVLVDELPGPRASAPGAGLKLLMRHSIPVFVGTAAPAERNRAAPATDLSRVRSQVVPGSNGKALLRVRNDGAHAVRISFLSTLGPGGEKTSLGNGLIGYVLPGQQMAWPIDLAYPVPAGVQLKARFNEDREARLLPME